MLPILNATLLNTVQDSKLKDKKSVYRMSQKYKLQRTLLRELGHLAVYISLQEKELNDVLEAAAPYLSSKQPNPLQVRMCVVAELEEDIENKIRLIWRYGGGFADGVC